MDDTLREIAEALPETAEIADPELRGAVLRVWAKALAKGGFDIPTLKRMPFSLLIEGLEADFLTHVRTTCRLSIAVHDVLKEMWGSVVEIDRDTLIAGALLADVGKVLEYEEIEPGRFVKGAAGKALRHPFQSVGLCYDEGVPDAVMHIAAVHSWEGSRVKRTVEAIIFHHADFIDFEVLGGSAGQAK